ncbi:MAG: hypothetical protein WDM96_11545 [Lacunisphaera sp.]
MSQTYRTTLVYLTADASAVAPASERLELGNQTYEEIARLSGRLLRVDTSISPRPSRASSSTAVIAVTDRRPPGPVADAQERVAVRRLQDRRFTRGTRQPAHRSSLGSRRRPSPSGRVRA